MTENGTILKAMADEGILMSEEQLLNGIREIRSGSNRVSTLPGRVNGTNSNPGWEGMPEVRPFRYPGPGKDRNPKELDKEDQGTWRTIWTAPFRALREFYWLLDPDAKCRSVGLRTVGRVDNTQSEEHTDSEGGGKFYTHYVWYTYAVVGRIHTARKKVDNYDRLKKGRGIEVYYLPDTNPVRSAIDWKPVRAS